MNQIELALSIAIKAHRGQRDLDGKPAVLHPLAVGMAGETEIEMCVGYLHDVVEDTEYTFDMLMEEGVCTEVVDVLKLLCHDKNVEYMSYIDSIFQSGNMTAMRVKIKDLKHNIKRGMAGSHIRQVVKHTSALEYIRNKYANSIDKEDY